MKALSLTQPWATLVAIGAKRYETRSWFTSYRGQIAIHASKGFPAWAKETLREEPFRSVLYANGAAAAWLPLGHVIAICDVTACIPTNARASRQSLANIGLTEQEFAFGDYSEGRYAWRLENVRRLPEPIPAKGALGLWDWTPPEGFAL